MNRPLTQKQENFTLNILKGMTQREAWIQAGYSSNYALPLVDIHACALARKDKIKIRLSELRESAASPAKMQIAEREERLSFIARENNDGKFGFQRQPNITAIQELNKMDNIYEPIKVDLTQGLEELLNKLHGRQPQIEEGDGDSS